LGWGTWGFGAVLFELKEPGSRFYGNWDMCLGCGGFALDGFGHRAERAGRDGFLDRIVKPVLQRRQFGRTPVPKGNRRPAAGRPIRGCHNVTVSAFQRFDAAQRYLERDSMFSVSGRDFLYGKALNAGNPFKGGVKRPGHREALIKRLSAKQYGKRDGCDNNGFDP